MVCREILKQSFSAKVINDSSCHVSVTRLRTTQYFSHLQENSLRYLRLSCFVKLIIIKKTIIYLNVIIIE